MIRFANISGMNFLWLALGLSLFLWFAAGYKKKRMQKFVNVNLMDAIAFNRYGQREVLKSIILVVIIIFCAIAIARPQWGFHWQEVKHQGLDIVIAIDTSNSMLAQDVKPNRLGKAKLAVKDLVKELDGDRIGLVAFEGTAFLVCPLTVDYSGFLLSLDDLDPNTISRGGTSLSAAILQSVKGYKNATSDYRAVVIITDGENFEGDPMVAVEEAKKKGIKIFCIGIGTPEGELIRIKNEGGEYEFLKDDQGNFVKSRLNESILKSIALSTGGAYVRASGAEFGLDYIYETRLSKMEKREIESKMKKQYIERFQYPLFLALLLLILETLISTRKKI
ncbi:MAG: VWA domain-containing protein [Candidatus Aceula meridiana]|nr:VWA domain-containing protein [Candidatus Aceula meridiana]